METTTTLVDRLVDQLAFKALPARFGAEHKNRNNPATGGWINVEVEIELTTGKRVGIATISWLVYTDADRAEHMPADIYDEVQRTGFAFQHHDRHLSEPADRTWGDIFRLTLDERDELDEDELQDAILDKADETAAFLLDLEKTFAAALRERLANTKDDYTWSMIKAVRILEGEL